MLRETDYARELARATVDIGNGEELRIERLYIKDREREEIRFSWWKDGRMIPRTPDGTVDEWLGVFKEAIKQGVLPEEFREGLRKLL